MRKVLLLLVVLFSFKSAFCQSAFVQSNSGTKNKILSADTITLNWSEQLKGLSKTISELRSFTIKPFFDSAQRAENESKYQEVLKNTKDEKLKKQLEEENNKRKHENFSLHNQIFELQQKQFEYKVADLNEKVSQFDKSVAALKQNLSKREWRIKNKILSSDDDDEVLDYNNAMVLAAKDAEDAVGQLKSAFSGIDESLTEYKKSKERIDILISVPPNETVNNSLETEIDKANKIKEAIDDKLSVLEKNIADKSKTIETAQTIIDDNQKKIAKIYSKYKTENEDDQDHLKTIAGITQPLSNQGQLVPNISLLGFKSVSDENSSVAGLLKLFVAANTGNSPINSNYKLFIPEASTYGFMADFSLGFIPSNKNFQLGKSTNQPIKRLGINLGAYYLGKSMNRLKDSSTFNIGLLQFRTGMQYILIGNVLSIYANINPYFIGNGVSDFKENYSYKKGLSSFIDFGLECYLDLIKEEEKKGGLHLDLDLGFISAKGDVKKLSPSDDPLIPRIKLSIVKGFNF